MLRDKLLVSLSLSLFSLLIFSQLLAPVYGGELFRSGPNSISLSGYADMLVNTQKLNKSDQKESDDGQMSSGATRFRFTLTHQVSDQVRLELISEYFVNLVNGDFQRNNLFSNRLGAIGFTGKPLGDIRVGKYWAPVWFLTLGYLDGPIISDCDACGIYNLTDGGLRGVGRLDKGITYLRPLGSFTFGAQAAVTQAAEGQTFQDLRVEGGEISVESGDAERDWNYGLAVNWRSDFGLTLGAGWTQSRIDVLSGVYYGIPENTDVKSEVLPLVVDFKWRDKLKISSSVIPYARYYHVTGYDGQGTRTSAAEMVRDSSAADLWIRYRFTNTLTPYVYLSYIDMDDICQAANGSGSTLSCLERGDSERFTGYIGAMYWPTEQLALSLGYDYTDFETAVHGLNDNDRVGFKIRYWYSPGDSGW